MPIRVLDAEVANQIAAGEVVERPSSVVKELLDNAIDAGARQVRVEVRGGGSSLIRISDDGCGIPPDEVELAFLRHATSKVRNTADLDAISTLGFRGEALPSIAAVSEVTITTRTEQADKGIEVHLEHGNIASRVERIIPTGTTIAIQNLFGNIPARKKFLKTPNTELAQVQNVVTQYALTYPHLRLSLVNEGRTVFQSPGTGQLLDVLIQIYGAETAGGMVPVGSDDEMDPVTDVATGEIIRPAALVQGYTGLPHVNRASRQFMTFCVNGRPIQNRLLGYAVEEAYHTLLQVGRHPIAVLHLTVPVEEVDVNVHPAKTEVRFMRERAIFGAVQRAVRAALLKHVPSLDAVPAIEKLDTPQKDQATDPQAIEIDEVQTRMALSRSPLWAPQPSQEEGEGQQAGTPRGIDWDSWNLTHAAMQTAEPESSPVSAAPPPTPATANDAPVPEPEGDRLPALRLVGQLSNSFILAEGPAGLYILDQHAAHERVLYETFRGSRGKMASQLLLEPLSLEFPLHQAQALRDRMDELQAMGFQLEPHEERTFVLKAVPQVLARADIHETMHELVDQLLDARERPADWREALGWRERVLSLMACRGAIKAGQSLRPQEMEALLQVLEGATLPRCCFHGRPTMLQLSHSQLAREFGRR